MPTRSKYLNLKSGTKYQTITVIDISYIISYKYKKNRKARVFKKMRGKILRKIKCENYFLRIEV